MSTDSRLPERPFSPGVSAAILDADTRRPGAEPRLFWRTAFFLVVLAAIGAVLVLANAERIDAGASATLPARCDALAVEGHRLVVTFTLRDQVIHITCRPVKAAKP